MTRRTGKKQARKPVQPPLPGMPLPVKKKAAKKKPLTRKKKPEKAGAVQLRMKLEAKKRIRLKGNAEKKRLLLEYDEKKLGKYFATNIRYKEAVKLRRELLEGKKALNTKEQALLNLLHSNHNMVWVSGHRLEYKAEKINYFLQRHRLEKKHGKNALFEV